MKVSELMSNNVEWMKKNQQTWSIFYNLKEWGAVGDNVHDDKPIFDKIIQALGGENGMIIVPKGTFRIGTDLVIPENVTLYFVGEGRIAPRSIATLIVNGPIIAGPFQIFDGFGTTNGSHAIVDRLFPQWWGAKGDGITDDTLSITKTRQMAHEGSTIFFLSGLYKVTDNTLLTNPSGSRYLAEGYDSNFLYNDTLYPIPTFTTIASLGPDKIVGTDIGGALKGYDISATMISSLPGQITLLNNEIDEVNNRVSTIIAHNGDGTKDTELVDARGSFTVLGDRLSSIDDIVNYVDSVNLAKYCIGDGITDDTESFRLATLEATGKRLILPAEMTCLITDSIVLPHDIIFEFQGKIVMDGDVDYWFDGSNTDTFIVRGFNGELTIPFGTRTKLNRVLFTNESSLFQVNNVFVNGASTAIHCLNGDKFICSNVTLRNVFGTLAQYGYGINSSAKYTNIYNLVVENDDNTNGRHAIYINGGQWVDVRIHDCTFKNWNQNPINVTNTNTSSNSNIKISNIEMENVNYFITTEPRGAIHFTNSLGNAGVKVSISGIRFKNVYGTLIHFGSNGYDNASVEGITISSLPVATNNPSTAIMFRGGKYQSLTNVTCESLNDNWLALVNFRDSTECVFDNINLFGEKGSQVVRIIDSNNVVAGNVYSQSVSNIFSSNSTINYKSMKQRVTYGTVAPTTGSSNRGDIHWITNASSGSSVGWVCVTSGTPGTWLPFGLIGISKLSSQSDSVATDVASLKTDFNNLLAKLRTAGLM